MPRRAPSGRSGRRRLGIVPRRPPRTPPPVPYPVRAAATVRDVAGPVRRPASAGQTSPAGERLGSSMASSGGAARSSFRPIIPVRNDWAPHDAIVAPADADDMPWISGYRLGVYEGDTLGMDRPTLDPHSRYVLTLRG